MAPGAHQSRGGDLLDFDSVMTLSIRCCSSTVEEQLVSTEEEQLVLTETASNRGV
jgi:hypothetical protein